jgi:hypothetical protein
MPTQTKMTTWLNQTWSLAKSSVAIVWGDIELSAAAGAVDFLLSSITMLDGLTRRGHHAAAVWRATSGHYCNGRRNRSIGAEEQKASHRKTGSLLNIGLSTAEPFVAAKD